MAHKSAKESRKFAMIPQRKIGKKCKYKEIKEEHQVEAL
jgi:hypothetical protein